MNGPNLKYSGCVAKADVRIHRFQLDIVSLKNVMRNKELRIISEFSL